MLYWLHLLNSLLCEFSSVFSILCWLSFFKKKTTTIHIPFLSVTALKKEQASKLAINNQVDRCLWELCSSFWVTPRASLETEFLPWRLWLIFCFWFLILSLKGRRHQKVTTELKLKSDPLTLLHEPFILFSGIDHILFVHCKYLESIHWIPFSISNRFPKGFLGKQAQKNRIWAASHELTCLIFASGIPPK